MKEKQNVTPERLAELVGLARNGDQSAYTALYEATSQEVYRTVRSMVRSEETALDVQNLSLPPPPPARRRSATPSTRPRGASSPSTALVAPATPRGR